MSKFKNAIISVITASLVVAMLPLAASADATSDMQAQIAALLAQVQALTTQLNASQGMTVSGTAFTRDLTVGSTGSDVMQLQKFLNAQGYVVAVSGAGSVGNESTYFGAKTKAALAKWQAAKGISPAVGYFGPKTRAAVNAMMTTTGTGTGTGTGSGTGTGGGTTAPAGTSLTVALAADNVGAGSLVAGAARVPVLGVTYTAGTGSAITISSVAFRKTGVVSDSNISGAYLVMNGKVVAQYGSISNGLITFSGLNWQIPAGTSQEVWLAIDTTGANAGNTVAFSLAGASDISAWSGSTAVTPMGNFPINGNTFTMTTVSSPSLATVTITSSTVGSQVFAGTQNVLVSQWTVNTANSPVKLSSINFRVVGSAHVSDLQNVKLYVNGTQVGTTLPAVGADGSAYFDLTSAPITLGTGNSNLQVYADVMGSPSFTFQFELLNTYDVYAVDTQYNVPVRVSILGGAGAVILIQQGQLTVTLATDSPTGNVAKGQSSVTIMKAKIYAAGESVRVQYLDFNLTVATTGTLNSTTLPLQIKNVSLVDDAGQQVGSTINTPLATLNACQNGTAGISGQVYSDCFGTPTSPINYTVPANTTRVLSLKVDIQNTASFTSITGALSGNTLNLQGLTSSQQNGSGAVSGAARNLASSALTVTLNSGFGSQNLSKNASNQRVGSFTFSASSAEGVNINNLTITTASTASNFNNLVVKVNGVQFGNTYSSITNGAYTFSGTPFLVPAGGSVTVDVYMDTLSTASGSGLTPATLTGCTGTGATSFSSISCVGSVTGQSVTVGGTPALTVSVDSSLSPAPGQIVMGTNQAPLAAFRFTETSNVEAVNITDLNIFQSTATGTKSGFNASTMTLYQGGSAVGTATLVSQSANGTADANGGPGYYYQFHFANPVVVPKAGSITLVLKGNVSSFSNNQATDNSTSTFRIATSTDAGNTTTSTVITAKGGSNTPATVTLSNAVAFPQTILRNNLTVTATPLGAATGRNKAATDDIAQLTFTPGPGDQGVILNQVILKLSGNLATSTFAALYTAGSGVTSTDIELYDSSSPFALSLAQGTATSSSCATGSCSVTFNLGAGQNGYPISSGSPKTFTVRVNSQSNTTPGANGISESFGIRIVNPTDVLYTDSLDGVNNSVVGLPANIVPITVNSVVYGSGQ